MSETTLDLPSAHGPSGRAPRPMLVLAWSAHDPTRVGELLDPGAAGGMLAFGRSEQEQAGSALIQQRPGRNLSRPPLGDPWLSRRQLEIQVRGQALRVRNVGRCPLWIGPRKLTEGIASPGDVLVLERRAVFLCVIRSPSMPALGRAARFAFGGPDPYGMVGESPGVWLARHQLELIASREEHHVIVFGESGTGKELAARAIHAASRRAARPLISRNASTFPESLMDAELFGHARNYPNPGMPERPGLFGEADGGVLFLDELGELPDALQAHLLRVLDDGEYQRLGEPRSRKADVRVIGATNRAPHELRRDLLARFALQIALPSIKQRLEDVPLLFRHLLKAAALEHPDLATRFFEAGEPRVEIALIAALLRHAHPLNVRGLNRIAWQALLGSTGDTICLTDEVKDTLSDGSGEVQETTDPSEITADQLRQAMAAHDGKQAAVWKALGLRNRYVLRRLLKKFEERGEVFE